MSEVNTLANSNVLTTTSILSGKSDILFVSLENSSHIFACGDEIFSSLGHLITVPFSSLIEIDASVKNVVNLDMGDSYYRNNSMSPWKKIEKH